jgi:hypothetical protein
MLIQYWVNSNHSFSITYNKKNKNNNSNNNNNVQWICLNHKILNNSSI